MPEAEESVRYFSFSIPNLPGNQHGGLGDLVRRMIDANIELQGTSGSSSDRG